MSFRVEVRRPEPPPTTVDAARADHVEVTVATLHGLLDRSAADVMGTVLPQATASGAKIVVLDLSDVIYINSTGIALVVRLLAEARTAALEVRVCGLTDHYRHIFEITRLVDLMTCFPDERSAVAGTAPVA